MSKVEIRLLVAVTCLIAIQCVRGEARTNRKLITEARFIARIDFECVTSKYPKRSLARVVRAAMKGLEAGDIGVFGNRAIAFDLNKDARPEYFIPLECGATGNCKWGIFAPGPQRHLGTIPAEHIYIQRGGGWPVLVTYIHSSASDGVVSRYKYTRNRYVKTGDDFEVSVDRKDIPKSMEKVHSTCKRGNTSTENAQIDERRSGAHE